MHMPPVTRRPVARSLALPLAAAALAALALPAGASQINTGGTGGAYEASFCPVLAQQLKLAQFDYALHALRRHAREHGARARQPAPAGLRPARRVRAREPADEGRGRAHPGAPGRRARVRVRRHPQQGHHQLRRAGGQRRPAALHPAAGRLGQRRHLPVPARASMPTASARPRASPTRPPPRMPSARRSRPTTRSACSCSSPTPTPSSSRRSASSAATSCR